MKISRFVSLVICAWSFAISCASAAPLSTLPTNQPAQRAVIFSTTHRYAISGCPAAQGLQIATWAEDVEARMARFLGIDIPAGDPLPLQIRVAEDSSLARGRIIRSQGYDAGLLSQKLDMINPRLADQEDLLEGLCSLLLSRAMVEHLPPSRGVEPPRAPDWLAIGIAQNLYAEGRRRNTRAVVGAWRKGGGHSMRDILRWEFMPEGRWDDKFEAGLFVEYMLPPSVAAKRTMVLLARIESGDAISAEFLAQRIFYCGSVVNAEKSRDLWLAQQQDVQVELGGISPERVAGLVQMLQIRPTDFGIPEATSVPLLADMRDLIRHRKEKWVGQLAPRIAMKMQTLAIGQADEFQRVIAGYLGFLDALGRGGRGFFRAPSESSLSKLLDQAEAQFIDFQATRKQRDAYIQKAASAPNDAPAPAPDAIRSYLDSLEQKFPGAR